jgi:hypothetical protein
LGTRNACLAISLAILCAGSTLAPAYAQHGRVHHGQARHRKSQRHVQRSKVAPADEYFGRLKMSILGIQNEIRDLSARLRFDSSQSQSAFGPASLLEDAIRDWERKYPADPWLAKSVYGLQRIYAQIQTTQAQHRADSTLHWLLARYGSSPFAAEARLQIGGQK